MFGALNLTLLIGPLMVPLPAPLPVTEALQRIEVNSSKERSGFQITFGMGKSSPLQLALLPARRDLAARDFAATKLRVGDEVLSVAAAVRADYYGLVASQELLAALRASR